MRTELIQALRSSYAIPVTDLAAIPLGSTALPGYLIKSSDAQYLLKPLPDYRSWASASAAARFQLRLTQAGAPIAPLVPTTTGEATCSTPFGPATLQVWLDGVPAQVGSREHCRATLAAITEVGALSIAHLPAFPSALDPPPEALWPDTTADWSAQQKNLIAYVAAYHPRLLRDANRLCSAVDHLCRTVLWSALPRQFIHGDPGPDNTIYHTGIAFLIDFDDARLGFRLWDPARTVGEFGVDMTIDGTRMQVQMDLRFIASMTAEGAGLPELCAAERRSWQAMVRLAVVSALFGRLDLDWELNGLSPPNLLLRADALELLLHSAQEALDMQM